MVAAVSQPEGISIKQEQHLKTSAQPDAADTSPGTPPAEKPTLSPPPPDTPLEGNTPTSTSSDDTRLAHASSAQTPQHNIPAKSTKDESLNAQAPAFVPNAAAAPFIPASLSGIKSQRYANGTAGQMLSGHSPTASNTASPHAAWEEAGYADAAAYGNGYSMYGSYGSYGNGYGYSYNAGYCMTSDGLFVPQQGGAGWGVMQPPQPPPTRRYANDASNSSTSGYTMESDALVAVLQEQFPLYNQDSLTDVLKVNGYDMAAALDMLAQLESEQTGQRKQSLQAPPSLDEDNFPSLATSPAPSAAGTAATAASAASPTANGDATAAVDSTTSSPAESPRQAKSALTPGAAQSSPAQSSPAAWGTAGGFAHKAAAAASGKSSSNDTAWNKAPQQKLQQAQTGSRLHADADNFKPRSKSTATKIPWVETGAAVSGQYADAREEARDHARLRNMYFQQATQAYLIGNKALAKELGAKGREHSDHMKAAHAVASETIFQQRNARNTASAVSNRNGVILLDLHGLHVAEALKILRREIGQLQQTGQGKGRVAIKVHILVGTGHHTKGARTPARLPVAVETFLQGEALKYTKPDPGLLQIIL